LNVGRYNSPHLTSILDCIVINGDPVDERLYTSVRTAVERVDSDLGTKLSNFELLTLTALQIFERVGVDIAVVEVGMGGRLDATNIIPNEAILVSAITSVDLDHQAFLGNTVSAIAKEKAEIARPGRPFVLGPQKYPDVVDVVKRVISGKNSDLVPLIDVHRLEDPGSSKTSFCKIPFHPPSRNRISCHLPNFKQDITAELPLQGDHQVENLSTALTTISALLTHANSLDLKLLDRLSPLAVTQGIKDTQWQGRLSFHTISTPRPLPVLVDGAHNPASAKTLAAYINWSLSMSTDSTIDLVYIIALSHSPPKTPLETLSPLLPPNICDVGSRVKLHVATVDFSPPEGMPWVKPVPPVELSRTIRAVDRSIDLWDANGEVAPGASLLPALEWAANRIGDAGLVVIAGSLYLVADFYRVYM
jgi:folylpolyglutamate synthase